MKSLLKKILLNILAMMMTKHTVFTLLLLLFCKIGFGQYKINSEVQDFTLKNIDEQMM